MEEKKITTERKQDKQIVRSTICFDLNDERQYQTVCRMEQHRRESGKSYNDIFVEAMLYWIKLFRCEEYPWNINLVAEYFEKANKLEQDVRRKKIYNPDFVPDLTEKELLEEYLEQVNALPRFNDSM